MENISFRQWDSKPKSTRKFKLVTKLTDLGSVDGTKSILGMYINVHRQNDWTKEIPNAFTVLFEYRTSTGHTWRPLINFEFTAANLIGTQYKEKMFTSPIRVHHIQVRLRALLLKGDVTINDFGLIFSEQRKSSPIGSDE